MSEETTLTGTFHGRSEDKMDMVFKQPDGGKFRVDPFVGCVVLPNDYDPFTDDAAALIQDKDYKIKEDELASGTWEVTGNWHYGLRTALLVSSMRSLPPPPKEGE